jgi:plasmid stabilization system protein ParE
MLVELRVEARTDLEEGAAFYESQREGLGKRFMDCLFADLKTLESQGGIHETSFGFHRKLSARFPFAIYYRVEESIVDVVAVLDCRQDPNELASRLTR